MMRKPVEKKTIARKETPLKKRDSGREGSKIISNGHKSLWEESARRCRGGRKERRTKKRMTYTFRMEFNQDDKEAHIHTESNNVKDG